MNAARGDGACGEHDDGSSRDFVNPLLALKPGHAPHERLPWRNVLAPMEGVGHPAFRHAIAAQGGLDLVCTEFVRVTSSELNPELIRRAIQPSPGVALSVQPAAHV